MTLSISRRVLVLCSCSCIVSAVMLRCYMENNIPPYSKKKKNFYFSFLSYFSFCIRSNTRLRKKEERKEVKKKVLLLAFVQNSCFSDFFAILRLSVGLLFFIKSIIFFLQSKVKKKIDFLDARPSFFFGSDRVKQKLKKKKNSEDYNKKLKIRWKLMKLDGKKEAEAV